MNDLRQMLFEKGRVGRVLDLFRKEGIPDPQTEPDRALLYAHALYLYGDFGQAQRVYSVIPPHPSYEAERLWGLATTLLQTGNLGEVNRLLDEALVHRPPDWLTTRIYATYFGVHRLAGDFEEASRTLEKGIVASEREPAMVMRWVLEGNRGVIESHRGLHEEAILSLGRAVKQLSARDAVLAAGHHLINLAEVCDFLGDFPEAGRYLARAEKLIQESGSMSRLIFLRIVQGGIWKRMDLMEKAGRFYEEARALLREFPIPVYEIMLGLNRASLSFGKGNVSEALRQIREVQGLIREKGLPLFEGIALLYEGSFLVRAGTAEEGLRFLGHAASMAEENKRFGLLSEIALFQAYGHEELKQREEALERMTRCLAAVEASRSFQEVLSEREVLIPLLLRLGDCLPVTDTLSTLIVQLRHPGLVKRLLRHSPKGKVLFLRSLKVHDARCFRLQFAKLRNDPEKEVRRTSRLILNNWQNHAGYRVYTLGTFRVFLEGKPLTDKDWGQSRVKRLFLYFATHPGEWQATEILIERLLAQSGSRNPRPILRPRISELRSLFEPWHLLDMAYAFFQSQRGAYGFFPGERFWMDYQEFEKEIKQAEQAQLKRSFTEARKAYREALNLYLGDYLEEFPYEDFLRPKRDYLRELYFRGVLRYATLERESGNLPEARRVLEEALFKDLSRCDCITLLIQTLAQMKLTQQAKDWGQRHIIYMKKELKEKPAPEVVEALGKLG